MTDNIRKKEKSKNKLHTELYNNYNNKNNNKGNKLGSPEGSAVPALLVTSVVLLFATNLVINDERRREDATVTMMSGTYPWSSGNDSHCE